MHLEPDHQYVPLRLSRRSRGRSAVVLELPKENLGLRSFDLEIWYTVFFRIKRCGIPLDGRIIDIEKTSCRKNVPSEKQGYGPKLVTNVE